MTIVIVGVLNCVTFAIREDTKLEGAPPLTSAPALQAKCNKDRSVRLSLSSMCAPLRSTYGMDAGDNVGVARWTWLTSLVSRARNL